MLYMMQARSSVDGKLYTWRAREADFGAHEYFGPGTPQEIAVLLKPDSGGVRVLDQTVINFETVPPSTGGLVVAALGLATTPGPALVHVSARFQLNPVLPAPAGVYAAALIRIDGVPLTKSREFGFYPTPYTVISPLDFTVPIEIPDSDPHSYTVTIDADANTTALVAETAPGLFAILR